MLARVVPDCSSLLAPLDSLTAGRQSNDRSEWADTLHEAFKRAHDKLHSNRTIALPSMHLEFRCSPSVLVCTSQFPGFMDVVIIPRWQIFILTVTGARKSMVDKTTCSYWPTMTFTPTEVYTDARREERSVSRRTRSSPRKSRSCFTARADTGLADDR